MSRPAPSGSHVLRTVGTVAALLALLSPVVHAFYLISPLSYWPATIASGNVAFEVALTPSPPNRPNPPLTDGSASWDAAFVTQMNAWNAILPDNVLVFQAHVGSVVTPVQGDGVNNVFFSPDIYGDSWGSSTAGICLAMWTGNRRTEADILFNAGKTWDAYTGNLQGNVSEFRRVALHELGHALLLDHPDDAGQSVAAIMNSVSSNTDALTTDDIAGVTAVFGALTPLAIAEQPRNHTTNSGQMRFNVTAAGSEPITYQWQRSSNGGTAWSNLAGFDFPNGSGSGGFGDGDLFRVVVTNPVGSVTSRPALLTITGGTSPATFTASPANATVQENEDVIFTVSTGGSPSPTIQWEYSPDGGSTWNSVFSSFGQADVSGAQTPTLKITRVISAMNGFKFRAEATNSTGNPTSAAASLVVNAAGPGAYFSWQPLDVFTTAGTTTQIVAGVGGSPTPSKQWQRSLNNGSSWSDLSNDATFSGVTSSTLKITNPGVLLSGQLFRLAASNSGGSVTTRAAMLSVVSAAGAPTILGDPAGASQPAGGDATFSAIVSALPQPVWQWQYSTDGVNFTSLVDGLFLLGTDTLPSVVTGSQTRTLALSNLDAGLDGVSFRLVATNAQGSDTSAAAALTIGAGEAGPSFTIQPVNASITYPGAPSFSVAVSGTPAPTLQWQISINSGSTWSDLASDATFSGVTSSTLALTNPPVSMSGNQFRAVASNSAGSTNSSSATLTVTKATATITLANLARSFTGSPLSPTATTTPVGLAVDLTFDGSASVPSAVDAYALQATINDANYQGSASDTFMIVPTLVLGQPATVASSAGGATTLSVKATSGGAATYQWQLQPEAGGGFADVVGATEATYTIASSQRFHAGGYRVLVTTNGITATSGTIAVSVNPPAPSDSRLLNLSTRGYAQSGDNILIPGFVVQGSTSKRLLIRAVGPTLALPPINFGDPVTPDPVMTLKRFNFTTMAYDDVDSNDDWGTNANAADISVTEGSVGAFALKDTKDAALLVDLPAGQYSVFASDKNQTSGIAIVEVYDADSSGTTARLINISNRGFCGVGGRVMIPGFVVSPEGAKTLLIRVVGPTLAGAPYNVSGTMTDPKLELYKHNFTSGIDDFLLTQDNWGDNPDAGFTASTAAQVSAFDLANGSKDAAFVVTLNPGVYTVVGSSNDGVDTGIVLVEVYVVQ